MLADFLLDFHEVFAGGIVVALLLPLVFVILFLVAFWRIGTGTLQTAEANIRIAKALQELKPADEEINASLAQVANLKDVSVAVKAQAESVGALTEQAKLAVQWYVHSLQNQENGKSAKK